ncbi:hypothetical protein GAYE_SCF28MG4707 [Galdieria yellowstonensis]|uniref:SAM domain-containing protein n=1 Tax=Galdieria yellowstonensis TaxID=3028027 RepID=A0AAV9IHF1_9RHOD|nr:hypothetical protein GAYE_SCF28MG4707 [Galdieria yellowstonensis]
MKNFAMFGFCMIPNSMPTGKKAEAQVPRGTKSAFVSTLKTSTLPFKWNCRRSRRLLCTIYPGNQADSMSAEASSGTSGVAETVQDKKLKFPLVNRPLPVLQILENFRESYIIPNGQEHSDHVVHPYVSFATQCCGIGKTTLGEQFRQLLLLYRDYFVNKIGWLPGVRSGSNVGELAMEALINETLYVSLDLRRCPRGKCFEETLEKWIIKEVACQYPNCSELLSKNSCGGWLENIFHATNKRYLFLFIDENGVLKDDKLRSFADLWEIDKLTGRPNPLRCFFKSLDYFVSQRFVICLVAGIPKCIVEPDDLYALVPMFVELIDLDPFSKKDIESFVRGTTYGNISILKFLFPSNCEGINWFFEMIHDYTAGIPAHVVHVVRELTNLCTESKEFSNLSRDEMKERMERILADPSLIVTPVDMTPRGVTKFCALLLASVWELPILETETFNKDSTLFPDPIYVLDSARRFGFYRVNFAGEELDIPDGPIVTSHRIFKLIFPKIVLRYIGEEYWKYPCFRFIWNLFASINNRYSNCSGRSRFEIVFCLILYVRLSCCKRMGELSIFRRTLAENISMRSVECNSISNMELEVKNVPAFCTAAGDSVDNADLSNAWKLFYEHYLSRDGIYLREEENSYGPGVLIRISDVMQSSSITCEGEPSSEQISNPLQKQKTYLIGISMKCYDDSSCTISHDIIKEEVASFLSPVSSQLDLEEGNVTVIQLIVSNRYTADVRSRLKNNQSWILDSGVHYEDGNGQLTNLSLSSQSFVGSHREWLTIPSRCQLVICSPQSLTEFLGGTPDNKLERLFCNSRAWWEHFKLLWTLLENSLQESLKILSSEKSKQDAGAVAQGKSKKMKAVSSSVGSVRQVKFDWMEFLKTYCNLTESEARECSDMLKVMIEEDMMGVDTAVLERLGIEDPAIRLRVVAGIRSYLRNKPHM